MSGKPTAPSALIEGAIADVQRALDVDAYGREDAADLLRAKIRPLEWAVEDLIPEGLGILGSAPKIGKSLLALQVCVALRTGDFVLGHESRIRPTLLYSLEDGRRVTRDRLQGLLADRAMPSGLTIVYRAPRLGQGLEEEIGAWLDQQPNGLVWIDMLAKVRPSERAGVNAYSEDYAALGPLHEVTRAHPGATVLVNTHDRKAGSEDWMTRITGTRGITGVGEFVLFLNVKRTEDVGTLYVVGREVRDVSIEVYRDYPRWTVARPEQLISQERRDVLEWLSENGPAGGKAYAEDVGIGVRAGQKLFERMAADGLLWRLRGGRYTSTPIVRRSSSTSSSSGPRRT